MSNVTDRHTEKKNTVHAVVCGAIGAAIGLVLGGAGGGAIGLGFGMLCLGDPMLGAGVGAAIAGICLAGNLGVGMWCLSR